MRIRYDSLILGLYCALALILASCEEDPIGSGDDDGYEHSKEPVMTISEPSFDFGYCPQMSMVTHIFWLHSTGTDTLRILRVVPG